VSSLLLNDAAVVGCGIYPVASQVKRDAVTGYEEKANAIAHLPLVGCGKETKNIASTGWKSLNRQADISG
jgi:hypothetical protein